MLVTNFGQSISTRQFFKPHGGGVPQRGILWRDGLKFKGIPHNFARGDIRRQVTEKNGRHRAPSLAGARSRRGFVAQPGGFHEQKFPLALDGALRRRLEGQEFERTAGQGQQLL